jgi:hypothetical protein
MPVKRVQEQTWSAISFLTTAISLALAGCADPKTYSWDEYDFKLPGGGTGVLDVRPTHPYLSEFEYRLRGTSFGHSFSVEPCQQTGGDPSMRLEFVQKSKLGGPFLIIAHAVSGQDSTELLDLGKGSLVDLSATYPDPTIKALRSQRPVFIGFLDEKCDFRTSDGMIVKQSVQPNRVK